MDSTEPIDHSIYPPRDLLGRQYMRKFSWVSFVQACPWLILDLFKQEVPANFWSLDLKDETEGDDKVQTAVVACPCEEEPSVPAAECVECECGRFYLFTGSQVRVFRPEEVEAAVPTKGQME